MQRLVVPVLLLGLVAIAWMFTLTMADVTIHIPRPRLHVLRWLRSRWTHVSVAMVHVQAFGSLTFDAEPAEQPTLRLSVGGKAHHIIDAPVSSHTHARRALRAVGESVEDMRLRISDALADVENHRAFLRQHSGLPKTQLHDVIIGSVTYEKLLALPHG